ncbi:protein of unknown function [Rhodovastum atsumiense]|nr:protein of unknown function [Rhodovastum atsumiense]
MGNDFADYFYKIKATTTVISNRKCNDWVCIEDFG